MAEQPWHWTGAKHTFTFRVNNIMSNREQVVLFTCLRGAAKINVIGRYAIYYFCKNEYNHRYKDISQNLPK